MLHFNRTVIRNGSQSENDFPWAQCAGIFVASLLWNRFNVNAYSLIVLFSSSSLNKPENQGTFAIIGTNLAHEIVDPLIFYYHILSEEIKLWLNISNFTLEFDLLFPSNHAMKTARWYRVSRKKIDIALTRESIFADRFPIIATPTNHGNSSSFFPFLDSLKIIIALFQMNTMVVTTRRTLK